MDRLSFATLKKLGYTGYLLEDAPEKIVQFGEGNFLRAFADHFIDEMNEKAGFNAKVVLVQPRGGHPEAADRFGVQDGLYTLILRGRENGEPVEHTRVISAASRCLDPKRGLGQASGLRPQSGAALRDLQHHRGGHRLRSRLQSGGYASLRLPRQAHALPA